MKFPKKKKKKKKKEVSDVDLFSIYLCILRLLCLYLYLLLFIVFPIFPGRGETLVFDISRVEWSVAVPSPPSSIITNKVFAVEFC